MVSEPVRLAPGHVPLGEGWEGAPNPSLLVATDGTVLAANDAARRLFAHLVVGREIGPGLPAWLVEAAGAAVAEPRERRAAGHVGKRRFEAHAVGTSDGAVIWWLAETTDLHATRADLQRERENTAFLHAASDTLLRSLNAARTMAVAAELAAARLADAAWIIAPAARDRHEAAVCVRGERPRILSLDLRPDDVPGLAEALQGFPPVPSRWIDPSAVPQWIVPDDFGTVGPVVITSLPGHGVPAGALVLLRQAAQPAFDRDDEAVARLFAARVGAALSAARLFEQQSSITDVLTSQLLPPTLRRTDGIDFAGVYRPAQETARLGGDFYDVHRLDGGGVLALLGDVCGQGLEAAVLTGKIRNTMQALLPMAADHARMLDLLNSALLGAGERRFASMVLASAARTRAGVRLRLTRAGHLPPLIVRSDGRVEEVFGAGTLVGAFPEVAFATLTIDLGPGETCLLYTDGIVEARGGPLGGEMFGEDRLRQALSECAGLPAEAVVERVMMLAMQWLERVEHDDMAVLAITAPRHRS
jgi:serine phosphatase RsbU (regulator of sigma subunit)